MVFGGKPSKGCYSCIQRRIKVCCIGQYLNADASKKVTMTNTSQCDRFLPECSQCIRVNQACPGYRDELDLMFQDESRDVARRAQVAWLRRSGGSATTSQPVAQLDPNISNSLESENAPTAFSLHQKPAVQQNSQPNGRNSTLIQHPSKGIQPTLEDLANGFFFTEYVFGSSGSFEYLQWFDKLMVMDENLSASIRAVGLAGLSNARQSSTVMEKAVQQYGRAIRLTNLSLQTSTATKDSTLLSVMMLNLFESVVKPAMPQAQRDLSSRVHMKGATELVKLRGRNQFQNHVGIRMFRQLASQITIDCAQSGTAIPAEIMALRASVIDHLSPAERPAWQLSQIVAGFVNIKAAIGSGVLSDPADIIDSASHCDDDLVNLQQTMPPAFAFETIYVETSPLLIYENYCHIYQDFRVAQIWNLLRASRIICNEVIYLNSLCNCDSMKTYVDRPSIAAKSQGSRIVIQQMISEICATIPQQAGYLSSLRPRSQPSEVAEGSRQQGGVSGETRPVQGEGISSLPPQRLADPLPSSLRPNQPQPDALALKARAFSVLWPLYVAGRCVISDNDLRYWIGNRLSNISHTFGISQAMMLANILEKKEDIEVWSVYSMLGSYSRVPEFRSLE
jgi:hypothetical protein